MKRLKRTLALCIAVGLAVTGVYPVSASESDAMVAQEEAYFSQTEEFTRLQSSSSTGTNQQITERWTYEGGTFELVGGVTLIQRSESQEAKTLFTFPKEPDKIVLDAKSLDLCYYRIDQTVYRLYLPTGHTEPVYQSNKLESFFPLTNRSIVVVETNPVVEEMERQGLDPEMSGISMTVDYLYNIETGTKEPYLRYRGEEMPVSNRSSSVDYGDYGPGTYFTKTGKSCSSTKACHTKGVCSYITSSDNYKNKCNCLSWGSAIQCLGYARYVYEQNHGTTDWGSGTTVTTDPTTLKNAIEDAAIGSHIRLDKTHSVILTGTTSNGFTVYQCNADGLNCKVTSGTYSYSGVSNQYDNATIYE